MEWFRSTWQRGGAATAWTTWKTTDGSEASAMLKLPVGPSEHRWINRFGQCEPSGDDERAERWPVPRVFAAGTEVGGYDVAWILVERLPGHPLTNDLSKRDALDLLEAAAEFQCRACEVAPLEGEAPKRDWGDLVARSRASLEDVAIEHPQRWNEAIKKTQKLLPTLERRWAARPTECWCHGDLHPGNAMRRTNGGDGGACVLIDLAFLHRGHWIEDAVYLERQFWGHADHLHGVKPVSALRKFRKQRGLECEEGANELADIRRALMAACVPAFIAREGNPKYVEAALEILERILPRIS